MKTKFSLPAPLFEAAEQLARQLRLSHGELYARAIERFVASHSDREITRRLDEVYTGVGQSSELDEALAEVQRRTLEAER